MSDWRKLLASLVAARSTDLFPLQVFAVAPPSGQPWPVGLPCCTGLRDFYTLCDGGELSLQYSWLALCKVEPETARWRELLHDYHGDSRPVLNSDRHVVLATDSAGAPVIWDSTEDRMASFFWKGGGWESFGLGFEEFLSALFFRPEQVRAGSMWVEALGQLAQAGSETTHAT